MLDRSIDRYPSVYVCRKKAHACITTILCCLVPSLFFCGFRFCVCVRSSTLVRFVFPSLRTLSFLFGGFLFFVRGCTISSTLVLFRIPKPPRLPDFWLSGFSVYCVYVHVHVYVHDPPINHRFLTCPVLFCLVRCVVMHSRASALQRYGRSSVRIWP